MKRWIKISDDDLLNEMASCLHATTGCRQDFGIGMVTTNLEIAHRDKSSVNLCNRLAISLHPMDSTILILSRTTTPSQEFGKTNTDDNHGAGDRRLVNDKP